MKAVRLTRREFLRASVTVTGATVLAACAPAPTQPASVSAPQATAPTEKPTEAPAATSVPKTLARPLRMNMPLNRGDIGVGGDPGCSGAYNSYFINYLMFGSLVALDGKLQPIPDIAASWKVSDDGLMWTFNLRKDVKWSDGTSVTAKDFEWAVKRNLDPKMYCGGQSWQLVDIKNARAFYTSEITDSGQVGIKAPDDFTLQITLENPAAYFVNVATLPGLMALPRTSIEKAGDEEWTKPENVLTNGPFKLETWDVEKQMVFVPNDNYFGGAPKVEKLVVNMIRQEATVMAAYETDELDMVEVPPTELNRVKSDVSLNQELQSNAELTTMHLVISTQIKPLDDVRVRHAFAMAIDKETLCSQVLQGAGKPAYQFLAPGMLGYNPEIGQELAYNPPKAKQLLADAGYPDGKDIPKIYWQYEQNETYQTMFEALQAMIKENLGVETELAPTEAGARTAWRTQKPSRPHFYRQLWGADYPDPHNFMVVLYTTPPPQAESWKNYPELIYSNKKFDDLVWQAAKESDPQKRAELYRQCEQILIVDDPAIIPLYYVVRYRLIKPFIKGLVISGMGAPDFRHVSTEG